MSDDAPTCCDAPMVASRFYPRWDCRRCNRAINFNTWDSMGRPWRMEDVAAGRVVPDPMLMPGARSMLADEGMLTAEVRARIHDAGGRISAIEGTDVYTVTVPPSGVDALPRRADR